VDAPAAQPAVAQPSSAQPAVADAPVVELLSPAEQPVFAMLQATPTVSRTCADSGVSCTYDPDCEGVCGPFTCTCKLHNSSYTCVFCTGSLG